MACSAKRDIGWRGCALLIALSLVWLSTGCGGQESDALPPPTATATATATPSPTLTASPTPTGTPTLPPTSTVQATVTPTVTPEPRPTRPSPATLAAQYPELAPLLNNPEVDAVYKDLAVAYEEYGQQGVMSAAQQRGLVTSDGNFRAELVLDTADSDATIAQLQAMGIAVLGVEDDPATGQRRVQLAIPPALLMSGANRPGPFLAQLANLEHVIGLVPPR
jgi:hypothetical protein